MVKCDVPAVQSSARAELPREHVAPALPLQPERPPQAVATTAPSPNAAALRYYARRLNEFA